MTPLKDHADINTELSTALQEAGLLTAALLSRAETVSAQSGARLDVTLSELGLLEDEELSRFLATWLNLPFLTAGDFDQIPATGTPWDGAFLKRSRILPHSLEDQLLVLAMADPLDDQVADTIAFQHGVRVEKAVATPSTIDAVLNDLVSGEGDHDASSAAADSDLDRLKALANEGPVVRRVNSIIAAAIDAAASDIHFESQEMDLMVRFRIDGALKHHANVADDQRAAVISRLKVMAGLNISERRLPQDGRIRMAVRGREIDFRVSSLPTQYGESIVLRVLDKTRLNLDWPSLGFDPAIVARIEYLTSRPHGIFLVTGPTGSGKTTTLYTALSKLDATSQKIVTLEDPIEYSLPKINQVQVDPDIGYSFATALRSTLRQDPNVVMVGEIRDLETAENAIRAALMGRMVLSTVHTNSAIGAIDRLIDFGVQPFLLASTLRGVLSQRLVRKVCPECARPAPDPVTEAMIAQELGPDYAGPMDLREAVGCETCDGCGFKGRLAIAELLEMTDDLRDAVANWGDGKGQGALDVTADRTTLKHSGLQAVAQGRTTTAEIFQVVEMS